MSVSYTKEEERKGGRQTSVTEFFAFRSASDRERDDAFGSIAPSSSSSSSSFVSSSAFSSSPSRGTVLGFNCNLFRSGAGADGSSLSPLRSAKGLIGVEGRLSSLTAAGAFRPRLANAPPLGPSEIDDAEVSRMRPKLERSPALAGR